MTGGFVEYETSERIAHIRLNRPDRLNAMSNDMHAEFADGLRQFDMDEDVWVAVISGNGRAFCSGADVKSRQQRSQDDLRRRGGTGGPYGHHIWEMMVRSVNHKPIIAAVHGYTIGSGLSIALSSDLLVAARDTRFQVTEAQRGLPTINFLAAMGLRGLGASAIEVCLTGRFFDAEEAARWDLVNRVCEPGRQVEVALELAEQVLAVPPLSVRASVRHRRHVLRKTIMDARFEADPMKLYLTEDYRTSGQAFLNKTEPPRYLGR